jgi:hypothetical protein
MCDARTTGPHPLSCGNPAQHAAGRGCVFVAAEADRHWDLGGGSDD